MKEGSIAGIGQQMYNRCKAGVCVNFMSPVREDCLLQVWEGRYMYDRCGKVGKWQVYIGRQVCGKAGVGCVECDYMVGR